MTNHVRTRQRQVAQQPRSVAFFTAALAAVMVVLLLALSGCDQRPVAEEPTESAAPPPEPAPDPALEAACSEFWGDPDYRDPTSREVLDRAATAPQIGPEDPFFYAMTGDDIEAVFEQTNPEARAAAEQLAQWFRTEPERGIDGDREAFTQAWHGLAEQCADHSAAASWQVEPGEDGTKPAALVCADLTDTPSTLTHFDNSNVFTSNMFKLVGRDAATVPSDRMDDVRATDELLAKQEAWVDDDAVRQAIGEIRGPFQDALAGDMNSPGLQEPLEQLRSACGAVGYEIPSSYDDAGDGEQ